MDWITWPSFPFMVWKAQGSSAKVLGDNFRNQLSFFKTNWFSKEQAKSRVESDHGTTSAIRGQRWGMVFYSLYFNHQRIGKRTLRKGWDNLEQVLVRLNDTWPHSKVNSRFRDKLQQQVESERQFSSTSVFSNSKLRPNKAPSVGSTQRKSY